MSIERLSMDGSQNFPGQAGLDMIVNYEPKWKAFSAEALLVSNGTKA
jgi:hypothetical protein